jgi:hypothetical protein
MTGDTAARLKAAQARVCGPAQADSDARRTAVLDTLKADGLDSDDIMLSAIDLAGETWDAVVAGQEWNTTDLELSVDRRVTVASFIELALATGIELGRSLRGG